MAGTVVKTYSVEANGYSTTWTAPGGVKNITLTLFQSAYRLTHNMVGGNRVEVTEAGDAYAWGLNTNGGLGTGDTTSKSSPVLVVGGIKFLKVATGGFHCIGLDFFGRAWAWGVNSNGQLGDNTVAAKSSPVQVVGGLTFKDVCAGQNFSGGIADNGKAYGWGLNTAGGVGDASVVPKSSPVAVVGGLLFKQLVCGNGWMVGLTEAGAAYAWGSNANGQLGDASVTARSSPVAVVGGLTFHFVATGQGTSASSSYGITTAGAAYAWGGNNWGNLGTGNTTDLSSPVAVVGGLTFKEISGSEASSVGLTTAGAAYCWGYNAAGQLGTGSASPVTVSSPVAVVGGLTFVAVSGSFGVGGNNKKGSHHGITAAGAMYSWGDNSDGQLGDGTVVAKSSPVLVVGGLTFRARGYKLAGSFNVSVTPNTAYTLDFTGPYFKFNSVPYALGIFKAQISYQA